MDLTRIDVNRERDGHHHTVRAVLLIILAGVAYFFSARLGYAFAIPPSGIVILWPPSGVMLALLLLSAKREWPLLLLGGLLGNMVADLVAGNPLNFTIGAAFANAAETALAAGVLTRFLEIPVALSSLRAVLSFVVGAAILSNSLTALLGGALLHWRFHTPFESAWLTWWMGDGIGMLIVAPPLLAGTEMVKNWTAAKPRQVVEVVVSFAVFTAVAVLALGPRHGWAFEPRRYMLFPLLFWAALRFGPAGAAAASLILASITSWNAAHGMWPFATAGQPVTNALTQLYTYLGLVSLSSLIPAAILSEREKAERQLSESEERYRTMADTATDAIITIDEDSRILFANSATQRIFGYDPYDLEGKELTILMPEYLRLVHKSGVNRYIQTGQRHIEWKGVVLPGLHKDGREIPLEVSFGELVKHGHRFFTGIIRDISERVSAEQVLNDSKERYRLLFESHPLPIWVWEKVSLRFLEVNDAALALYGYSREEFLNMTIADIRPKDDVPRLMEHLQDNPGALRVGEWRHRKKDGRIIEVEIHAHDIQFGGRDAVLVAAQDITEQRTLTKQVAALQKFEAIGKLAGGIAHDFNNVIGAIMGWAEMAAMDVPEDGSARKSLDIIQAQSLKAAGLTHQLLAFARQQILERRTIDLNAVVRESLSLLTKVIGENIEVQTILTESLGTVCADPSQIDQVLMNLIVNARDAMPRGGRLVVETYAMVTDEDFCRVHPWARPGRYVCLVVSDTGTGMDPETLEHIFEPFFTTKGVGEGTGLGLATVYGIVKQHDGFVHVYSELGHGATFRIYLPRTTGPASDVKESRPAPLGGIETILVAEDHEGLRSLAQKALEAYGYKVLLATDGQEAVQEFEKNHDRIGLVLMDLVMPRLSGHEAYRKMCGLKPGLPVVFMTGYTSEMAQLQKAEEIGAGILQKPYSPKTLAAKVREVLDRH